MMRCDLCGTTARCLQKEIEGKEFDICEQCWHPLEEKLSGKGRVKETLDALEALEEYEEMVF
jgi:ribosome-binding protein aMBF1 (putative translation factor)